MKSGVIRELALRRGWTLGFINLLVPCVTNSWLWIGAACLNTNIQDLRQTVPHFLVKLVFALGGQNKV